MSSVDFAVTLRGGKGRRAGLDKQLLHCEGRALPRGIARKLETLF